MFCLINTALCIFSLYHNVTLLYQPYSVFNPFIHVFVVRQLYILLCLTPGNFIHQEKAPEKGADKWVKETYIAFVCLLFQVYAAKYGGV